MERFTIIGRQPDNYDNHLRQYTNSLHSVSNQFTLEGGMVEIIGQSIDVCISHRKIYKRFLLFSFDTATEAFMFVLNRTACRQ